eukprot:1356661-Rhodomonas_salina.1
MLPPVMYYPPMLSAYERAMRCPVLTKRMVLPSYGLAMQCPALTELSGTDLAYAPTSLRSWTASDRGKLPPYAMPGTDLAYALTPLRYARYPPTPCPALTQLSPYAMPGTHTAYAPILRRLCSDPMSGTRGTEVGYGATQCA